MADESRANFQELYLNQYLVKSNDSTTKILVRQFIFETKICAGCLMALDYFVAFTAIVLFLENGTGNPCRRLGFGDVLF
jgi:hypothetical protein